MAGKAKAIATIDFETEKIEGRPKYPPVPVGVSIIPPGKNVGKYWAFGHPTKNNCTREEARRALAETYASGAQLLCHNGKFDYDVAEEHMGLPVPSHERIEETMFLIFFDAPHSPNLALKPSAERILGMPPDEQDELRDWCVAQKLIAKNKKEYGEFISKTPGDLCGKYANGDTLRTKKIFTKLHDSVVKRGMGPAYRRECQLLPILLRNEREGIRVNVPLIEADAKKFKAALEKTDAWLRKTLKSPDLNLDSDSDLADAMERCGKAGDWVLTKTDQRSTSKDNLILAVTDAKLLQVMQYRSKLSTCYGTFIEPWLLESREAGGRVHPNWHQVRQHGSGARTGRISASRFMNAPKTIKEVLDKAGGYRHPSFIKELPELPMVRQYLAPDKGQVWVKRDYAQQEVRVLSHFEDGLLLDRYNQDPRMDVHRLAVKMLREQFGLLIGKTDEAARDMMKTIGFAILYGLGMGGLADRLNVSVEEAKGIKNAYLAVFPGLKDLQDDLKARARADLPLTTWGGRQYFCEEPKFVEKYGRIQTYEYKLLNYLIQGSSADITKEAIIRYDSIRKHGRFLICVHDEINLSVPKQHLKTEMALLNEAMSSVELDVLMLSDGAYGDAWSPLKKYEE